MGWDLVRVCRGNLGFAFVFSFLVLPYAGGGLLTGEWCGSMLGKTKEQTKEQREERRRIE